MDVSSQAINSRVLALAGLLQALKLVRQIAETGHADAAQESMVLDSVFRIDAPSAEAVYGGLPALRPGLMLLREHLAGGGDPALAKLAVALNKLERRFVADEEMAEAVRRGILAIAATAERQGSAHPDTIARLGRLYAETLSELRPKVIVQGNPHYLQQPTVVAEIRALLLAAMRSAVLWRQLGGSAWDVFLRRRAMLMAVEEALG